jgi:phosphoribosylformimino-5-aminoimidazole carboxamide ribotide isomerase
VIIFPAIDIRDQKCVRLRQGDFERETIYSDDPAEMARLWEGQGAQALHLVDLDGAKSGKPVNLQAITEIVQTVSIPCQVGGGIRNEAAIEMILQLGISRVILGSAACKNTGWLKEMAERYPEKILLGIDARDGFLAAEGWLEVLPSSALPLAESVSHLPLAGIIYTDIAHDGMLGGPNWQGLQDMAKATSLPVIASGGIATADDIRRLRKMNMHGCIIGRALYDRTLTLPEALKAAA